MTRKILVVGATCNGRDAVSGIVNSIVRTLSCENEIYFYGYKIGNDVVLESKNVHDISVRDPFTHSYRNFPYMVERKIAYKLNRDDCTITLNYAYGNLNKKTQGLRFDLVVGIAGRFCFIDAAYKYAINNGIKFRAVYFDPFVNNVFARNIQKRKIKEKGWLEYADRIFYNEETISPEIESDKFYGFKIPIPDLLLYKKVVCQKKLVYGGTFYKRIREPDTIIRLGKKLENTEYRIVCYSNFHGVEGVKNVEFRELVSRDDFTQICREAAALIYIGNDGGNSKSSKYLEYIGYRKPIIGINVEKDNEVRKYSFFIDASDENLIKKLSKIDEQMLMKYDPYSQYPDRDPKVIGQKIFE